MELRGCPFCGREEIYKTPMSNVSQDFYCPGCGVSVSWVGKMKKSTTAAWNRRAKI